MQKLHQWVNLIIEIVNKGGIMSNSENTNNSLKSREVSQEEIDAFTLDEHLISLMWSEPFFANMLRKITKVRTDRIPTAGVLAENGNITMWWNPKFLAGLSNKEIKGLLKHEVYHLVFEHTTKRKLTPHIVWNYATDLAINSLIDEEELPEGGLIPGKEFSPLDEKQKEMMGPKAVERYNAISQKIASFPVGESSEWYFSRLMEDPEVKEALENSEGTGGKSLEQALADGDVKVDENGNLVDGDGNPVTIIPGNGMDDHSGWDKLSDEQREMVKGQIKQAVEDATRECDANNSWGSVSSSMRKHLRKMISKTIPWQSVLKNFVGMHKRSDRTSSIRRINRKYPGIHPGAKRDYKAAIAIYVDQSGSVSDRALELLSGELSALSRTTEFVLYNFDTEVDENSERSFRKGSNIELTRTRCGGTCFTCVQKHANKNQKRFDGYLVLTDGYASDPGHSKLKRGWIITPGDKLMFDAKKKDFVIRMDDVK